MRSRAPLSWSSVNDFLPLPAFAPAGPPETALDIFRRACNDEELGIERMPMKRHDDTQRSGRLTVTQPVHHPVPPGLFHIL